MRLSVLTLNLHTYQEIRTPGTPEAELTDDLAMQRVADYGPVFDRIAAGIVELDPDIICLQEVGEWPAESKADSGNPEFGAGESNMVHQLLLRLPKRHYQYTMDWSHYGWGVWMEGSAILSKHPMSFTDSRFISSPRDRRYDYWKSRNVPMARIDVAGIGPTDVYSVHAGWPDDPEEPFQDQFRRLLDWTSEHSASAPTTILCGDFNVAADSPAYYWMTDDSGYVDQYLRANPEGMFDATIDARVDGWQNSDDAKRIDYILANADGVLGVTHARRVFSESDFGRVSDHVGIYAEFQLRRTR